MGFWVYQILHTFIWSQAKYFLAFIILSYKRHQAIFTYLINHHFEILI